MYTVYVRYVTSSNWQRPARRPRRRLSATVGDISIILLFTTILPLFYFILMSTLVQLSATFYKYDFFLFYLNNIVMIL